MFVDVVEELFIVKTKHSISEPNYVLFIAFQFLHIYVKISRSIKKKMKSTAARQISTSICGIAINMAYARKLECHFFSIQKIQEFKKKHSHTFSHSGYKAYFFPKDFFFLLECCANTCFTSLYYHLHQLIALISIDLVPSSIALEVQLKLKLIATAIDINAQ